MQSTSIASLSFPHGTMIAPVNVDTYEIRFSLSNATIKMDESNLVFYFSLKDKIIIKNFQNRIKDIKFIVTGEFIKSTIRASNHKSTWNSVKGHKCLYSKIIEGTEGNIISYRIQSMNHGKRFTDTLGPIPLTEAIKIRDTLKINRKLGTGPQTWRELQEKSAICEKPLINECGEYSLNKFRSEHYLPHRGKLARSAMDSQLMDCRWRNHIAAYFGEKSFNELADMDFENFVSHLRAKRRFGDTTIMHCLTDLRRIWAYAAKLNIAPAAFPGRETIREVRRSLDNEKHCYLEPEEARMLIRTAYDRRLNSRVDHDVYCYIVLGLALGLRAGEIHKLTHQSVERSVIERTKNKRSRFAHFLFAPVHEMLKERFLLYPPNDPGEAIFKTCDTHGRPRSGVPKKFYKLIAELGFNETPRRKGHHLEKIDFHALRHTFATMAAMRGVDHLTLMRLMGHRTPAMTLRYIEIADAHQAKFQEIAMKDIFAKMNHLPENLNTASPNDHLENTSHECI